MKVVFNLQNLVLKVQKSHVTYARKKFLKEKLSYLEIINVVRVSLVSAIES